MHANVRGAGKENGKVAALDGPLAGRALDCCFEGKKKKQEKKTLPHLGRTTAKRRSVVRIRRPNWSEESEAPRRRGGKFGSLKRGRKDGK